jgi:hypothetical protein
VSIAVLIVTALAVATITSFRDQNLRSPGPRWSHALDAAAERCVDRTEVRVPITPRPWVSRLPCTRLVTTGTVLPP